MQPGRKIDSKSVSFEYASSTSKSERKNIKRNCSCRTVGIKASAMDRLSATTLLGDGLVRSHSHESNLQYSTNSSRPSIKMTW